MPIFVTWKWFLKTILERSKNKSRASSSNFSTFIFSLSKYFFGAAILLLTVGPFRAATVICAYTWLRRVDDCIDEEVSLPPGLTARQYLNEKKLALKSVFGNKDHKFRFANDVLLVSFQKMSKHSGLDLNKELQDIFFTMCWDFERRNTEAISKKQMIELASVQDISIISFLVKIFDGDCQKLENFKELHRGIFTRIDWIADFFQDLQNGLLNISREDIAQYGLNPSRILKCRNWNELFAIGGFLYWYQHEANSLREQWNISRKILGKNFSGALSFPLSKYFFNKQIRRFDGELKKTAEHLKKQPPV